MIRRLLYCSIIILTSNTLQAQITSVNGWFEVDNDLGCPGLQVNMTLTPSAPCLCYSGCQCDTFHGDNTQSKNLSYTYNQAGVYYLKLLFPQPDGPDSVRIEILDKPAPAFNAYLCTNNRVEIDITDSNYDNYIVNYGDGFEETVANNAPDPSHSYANANPRTITVRGLDNGSFDNCTTSSQTITPLSSLPAGTITSLQVLNSNQIRLEYSNIQSDVLYQLQISPNNNGTFGFVKQVMATNLVDTISNLDMQNNFFCFRLATINSCDNVADAFSSTVCSINLSTSFEDNVNRLTWTTANPENSFDICRDGDCNFQSAGIAVRSYDDTNIDCNTDYCYQLVGIYDNGAVTSSSLSICGTSFSTTPPDEINNISVQVDNNNLELFWPEPPAGQIDQYLIVNNQGFRSGTSTTNTIILEGFDTSAQSHCFKIQSEDNCDNLQTAGNLACSILLQGSIDNLNSVNLDWNDYEGWENGVRSYRIEKVYGGGGSSTFTSNTNTFTEVDNNTSEQIIQYRIVALPIDNNLENAISNLLTLIKPNNIYFPNAFTPDGDGKNDTFRINGRFITSFELKIFNRWGEMVYLSKSMSEGWDGTREGRPLPIGTYAFKVDMTDEAGRTITKDGSVVLIRN